MQARIGKHAHATSEIASARSCETASTFISFRASERFYSEISASAVNVSRSLSLCGAHNSRGEAQKCKNRHSEEPRVRLFSIITWKNGAVFGALTPIDPKLCRRIRGWSSGPWKRMRLTKRSRSLSLVASSALVLIRDVRSARFSAYH